jgi:hypothetical protein
MYLSMYIFLACSARAATLQLWSCVMKRVHVKAIDILLYRGRVGQAFPLANRREARDRALYTRVDADKLHRVLDVDVVSELPKIVAVFAEHYGTTHMSVQKAF